MYVFELPEIGEGVVEGEMVRWLVNVGDNVATDQPICEIMTDKATVEISSPKSGKVLSLSGKPGDVIKVHSPLMQLDLGGGGSLPVAAPVKAATPAPSAPVLVVAPVSVAAAAPTASAPSALHPAVAAKMPRPPGEKALASPAVRHDAKARGLDIDAVPGSGKDGRVTRADLEAFNAAPVAVEPKAPPALVAPSPVQGDERVKIIGLRRKISEKMVQAWRTAPHFTYVDEVDASKLMEMRKSLLPLAESRGVRLSYLPFVMKALCMVFREFPTLNAVMDEEAFELVVRRDVNIGIATDTPAGLFVPVIKRVQEKNVIEIAREIAEITERTRNGKGKIDDFSGGSFTITSVGNIGGRFATPILNHPEVAILGVNQIHDRPVALNGQVVVRPMMYLSPSFDHRVIDGAVAARFVSALKAALENPWSLVLELR